MRTFIPMNNRVLLRGLTIEQVAQIIVPRRTRLIEAPESSRKTPQLFVVVGVGPKVEVLKPGDTVAMSEFLGTKLEFDGEEFIVAMEPDVMGVISGDSDIDGDSPQEETPSIADGALGDDDDDDDK